MNRYLSSPKSLMAAFALLIACTALPTRAQSLVSNKNFSLTFPAGWVATSLGSGESAISFVMKTTTGAIAYPTGTPHTGLLTAQEMADLVSKYSTADSFETTDSGTTTLGGKEFTFTEIVSTEDDSDSTRVRIYFLSQGNYLFEGILTYEPDQVGNSIAEFETALGTLALTPSAALHRTTLSLRPALGGTGHDALGRTHLRGIRGTERVRQPVLSLFQRR